MLHTALAAGAALVAIAFGLSTLDRWLDRRRPHELAWVVAFALFAMAAGFMAWAGEAGWSSTSYRGFYLFGAIVNVPFLALGTVLLRRPKDSVRRAAIWSVVAFCTFAAGVMVSTPFVGEVPTTTLAQGSDVLEPLPRVLAAVGSGLGAVVVFVGAAIGALRHHSVRNVIGNSLIAFGTFVLGGSGLLNSVFDEMTAFSVTLVVGISVLFCGFLVVTSVNRKTA